MSKNSIPYKSKLDSLRAIAAILVVILHFSTYLFPQVGKSIAELTPIVNRSYLFVDLFFILSGYVLALNYFKAFSERVSPKKYCQFLLKRFIKLYPLHFITLMSLVLLYWGLEPAIVNIPSSNFTNITNLNTLVLNLSLLQSSGLFDKGCYDCTSWNYPAWSISTEWILYLVMPFIFVLYKGFKKAIVLIIALLLLSLYYLVELKLGHLDYASAPALLRCFVGIIIGIALSQIKLAYKSSILIVNSCFIALFLFLHFLPSDTMIIVILLLVVWSVSELEHKHWLDSSWLIWLGKRSYSLYMIHAVVHLYLDFISRAFFGNIIAKLSFSGQFFLFFVVLIVTIIMSHYIYQIVELKLSRYLKMKLLF